MDREQIRAIVREVIEAMFESSIPVGVSNRTCPSMSGGLGYIIP